MVTGMVMLPLLRFAITTPKLTNSHMKMIMRLTLEIATAQMLTMNSIRLLLKSFKLSIRMVMLKFADTNMMTSLPHKIRKSHFMT